MMPWIWHGIAINERQATDVLQQHLAHASAMLAEVLVLRPDSVTAIVATFYTQ